MNSRRDNAGSWRFSSRCTSAMSFLELLASQTRSSPGAVLGLREQVSGGELGDWPTSLRG